MTRWGLSSHLEIKNNSVANRNRVTVSHYFFPILQSQQTQAYLQINVLLDAEFTTTRLKSKKKKLKISMETENKFSQGDSRAGSLSLGCQLPATSSQKIDSHA